MNSLTNLFSTARMRKSGSSIRVKNDTVIAILPTSNTKLTIPKRKKSEKNLKKIKKQPSTIKKPKLFWKSYIRKVLKLQHPQLSISSKSVMIVDNFVKDMFSKIVSEASHLVTFNHRKTLTHRDINAACKLILTGQLQDLATKEAGKAMIRFANSFNKTNHRTNDSDSFVQA